MMKAYLMWATLFPHPYVTVYVDQYFPEVRIECIKLDDLGREKKTSYGWSSALFRPRVVRLPPNVGSCKIKGGVVHFSKWAQTIRR